jgi:hypothetical protein
VVSQSYGDFSSSHPNFQAKFLLFLICPAVNNNFAEKHTGYKTD